MSADAEQTRPLTPREIELQEIEDDIAALCEKAEPYRALHDDDIRKDRLRDLVDEINTLRAREQTLKTGFTERLAPRAQMQPKHMAERDNDGGDARVPPGMSVNQAKRGVGRPRR